VEIPHNVPPALSSFVGRAGELAELTRALGEARLVTVTGPGGAGKTRVAREVAATIAASRGLGPGFESAPFDAIWWVELAPIGDSSGVAPAVAAVIGVRPGPGREIVHAIAESLRGADGRRRTLLVLDNCEHVVTAAAALADSLLRAVPGLRILATSREALAVEGERAWILPPLASPPTVAATAESIADYDAVRLFIDRAQGASPTFALTDRTAPAVAMIAARLDGLPLALELAAASVGAVGIDAVAARLDDAFTLLNRGRRTALPRHRTLRALLDWSYELLSVPERLMLARLATFRGPFTLEAAEAVGAGGTHDAVPDGTTAIHALSRLVEQSLIEVRDVDGETRFRLLETVKQYGLARLKEDASHEHAARKRHAEWVCASTESAAPATWSAARGRTVARLAGDVDEIRAALDWATGTDGDASIALRIGAAVAWFWFSGVPWPEARTRTNAILAVAERNGRTDDERPPAEQAWLAELLYPIAGLAFFAGDAAGMLTAGSRALASWESVHAALGRDHALAVAMRERAVRGRSVMYQIVGLGHAMRGEAEASLAAMDASVAIARAGGDRWMEAVMIARRGLANALCQRIDASLADYATALPLLRAVDEMWFLSLALEGMAAVELARGAVTTAAAHARDSIAVLRDEPDPWFISRSLDTLAAVLATPDAADRLTPDRATHAARLSGAATALRLRFGAEVMGADVERRATTIAAARATLGEAPFLDAWKAGEALDLDALFPVVQSDAVVPRAREHSVPASRSVPTDAPTLAIHVLGPLVVARDGARLPPGELPAGKATELLLFLVLHPEGRTKEQIGLALWPDASAGQLRANFHVTLHHLRRALGGSNNQERATQWISFADGRYRLGRETAALLDCDVDALLAASETLQQAERRKTALDVSVLDEIATALGRRRGELGEGLTTGDWLLAHEDRVRAAWARGMEALARQYLRAARRRDAEAALETLVAAEPLLESAHRALMELWATAGEGARALGHYDMLVSVLEREVGSAPARETQMLAKRLRGA
jgi:predicted ATPase/DNA-binding SARP family transcriptional activator